MSCHWRQLAIALLLGASTPARAGAANELTLERALAEARAYNARLPLAATDLAIARARLREARAQRWLTLSLQGDLRYAPSGASYNPAETANEERLQLVAQQPLYEGGQLRAAMRSADAELAARGARYRATVKDVELDVRTGYFTLAELDDELRLRRAGIRELHNYADLLELQHKAGQGVYADVLRTRARSANEEADIVGLERRRDVASAELDNLLGRDPATPLELAPLPPPEPPPALPAGEPWRVVPELREAGAAIRAAGAMLAAARAQRRPHLSLEVDGGVWGPGFSSGGSFTQRLRNDAGASIALSLSWDLLDFGAYRARLEQARLGITSAEQQQTLAQRDARLQWRSAMLSLAALHRELELRERAAPVAHDAWIEAVASYQGGAGTPIEVLTAWSTWISADLALASTRLDYRTALATATRWSTP
jgi:outer membrane protein